jgi:hypothetical protein
MSKAYHKKTLETKEQGGLDSCNNMLRVGLYQG